MKLIIAGSRTIQPTLGFITGTLELIPIVLDEHGLEIVSGCAKGVDSSAINWALKYEYKYSEFPADWNVHGKAAGHIRNKQMADYADALLLIWDGKSKGSANMKMNMEKLNKPIYEVIIK